MRLRSIQGSLLPSTTLLNASSCVDGEVTLKFPVFFDQRGSPDWRESEIRSWTRLLLLCIRWSMWRLSGAFLFFFFKPSPPNLGLPAHQTAFGSTRGAPDPPLLPPAPGGPNLPLIYFPPPLLLESHRPSVPPCPCPVPNRARIRRPSSRPGVRPSLPIARMLLFLRRFSPLVRRPMKTGCIFLHLFPALLLPGFYF